VAARVRIPLGVLQRIPCNCRGFFGFRVHVTVLPLQTQPPEPPPGIGPDSCRCHGGGEHLTSYALDELLHHLLTAA
ncbi:MAG TPA: hypothetical protein P5193_11095, partial [Microthrixaceae bacterium]|nr:hypothetical protein [Microthrixaceae bacterium]